MSRLHVYKIVFTKYFPLRLTTFPIRHSGRAMVLGAQKKSHASTPSIYLELLSFPLLFTFIYSPLVV